MKCSIIEGRIIEIFGVVLQYGLIENGHVQRMINDVLNVNALYVKSISCLHISTSPRPWFH